MVFGDRLPGTLNRGRAAARARMRATCVVRRPGSLTSDGRGGTTLATEQIYPDPAWKSSHPDANGPCRTRYPGIASEENRDVSTAHVVASRLIVSVPFGVVFRPGDVVKIVTDLDNPQLAGTSLPIASIDDQSQATAQRLLCVDLQAGVATQLEGDAGE